MTEPGQIRPGFIDVGPGRSGTSWLFEMLDAHPEIATAKVKETDYFNTHHARGEAWYLSHFERPGRAVGEVSNMYYVDEDVAGRIHAFDPGMRIVFNLREPRALLASMISFATRRGMDTRDPAILDAPIGRIMGSGYDRRLAAGATTRGDEVPLAQAVMLSRFIEPFRRTFAEDRIYYLVYERIAREPLALLAEIYGFLGVSPDFVPDRAAEVVNAAIEPRARWVGALVPKISFALRSMGAYRLLTAAHRSRAIKRALYRQPGGARAMPPLSRALERRLDEERERLIAAFPVLREHWQARGGRP